MYRTTDRWNKRESNTDRLIYRLILRMKDRMIDGE